MFESTLAPPPSNRKPNWIYITPLAIAVLPLIRIGLRHNPPLRNKVFYGAVGVFFIHGTWLITRTEDYDNDINTSAAESNRPAKETYNRAPIPRVRNPSSSSSSTPVVDSSNSSSFSTSPPSNNNVPSTAPNKGKSLQ